MRKYTQCDRCPDNAPGQLVRHPDETTEALCFTCWNPIRGTVKVLDWINKYGKLQHGSAS